MNRILKISVSVILAVFLIIGTFSTGMATDNPEVSVGTEPAASGIADEAAPEEEVIPPAADTADAVSEPEPGPENPGEEGTGSTVTEGDGEVTEPEPAAEQTADEPELNKLILDAGNGYTLASDTAFLKKDISLTAKSWKEAVRDRYKDDLTLISETEDELLTVSVRDAAELPFKADSETEVYIIYKDWTHKTVKDLQDLNLKLYLSDENGKLKTVKTEIKKNADGVPGVFFKMSRLEDILLTSVKDEQADDAVQKADGKEDSAVDVSEHPLTETVASDNEPLLSMKELSPSTKALLNLSGTEGQEALLRSGEALLGADSGEPTPEGGVTADGMTIEKVSVKWLSKSTGSEEPAGQGRLELETDSNVVGNQQFQLDFAISGKDDHEPGTVEIIFPAYIWLDRNGNEPGNLTLSVPEDPGEGADFAWKRVGNNIVITNVRRLSAASKVMIQGTFRNVKAPDMVDTDVAAGSEYASAANKGISNPLSVTVGITTPNDEYISLTSNSIDASINTHVEAASATKSAYNTSRREYYVYHTTDLAVSEGGIPSEFLAQLDDPSQYSFVRWYVSGSNTGSQPALMTVRDTFNGTVTHYLDAMHSQSETIQVSGKMLGVQGAQVKNAATGNYETKNVVSADGVSIDFVLYDGYSNLPKSAYVWTAYKQSDFPDKGDDYSVSNSQTVSVKGWDDQIITTKDASASTPFRTPIIYTIKKVWDDNNNSAGHRPNSDNADQKGQSFSINYSDDTGYHYGSHTLTDTEDWTYSWSDLGRDRAYEVYENTGSFIFRDHVIDGSIKYGEDDAGEYVKYDVWWYDREKVVYDSATHTWTTTNKYKERSVKRYRIPFAVPSTYAYMDKYTASYTNSSRMSRSDRALNILRRGSDVIVSYGVNGYAQTMAYTLGDGLEPGQITSYGRKEVTLELEDNYRRDAYGIDADNSLLFDDSIKLTLDDAEIAYVTLNDPSFMQYGQWGAGVPYGMDEEEWIYEYYNWSFKDVTVSNPPAEKLMGYKNGEWVEFASLKGGRITVSNGAKLSGRQVNLPPGVERVKTVLTVPGSDPKDDASWAERIDRAGMSYTVGVRLIGKSDTLQSRLEAVFAQNDYGMSTLDNFAALNIMRDGSPLRNAPTDWSRAWLHGRNHRVAVRAEKEFELVENDPVKRELKLHSKVTMTQQSNVLEASEYWDARNEGLIPSTESGTWYDLLPVGVMPDLESIKLTNGDKITDRHIVPNYKESGRVLLIVKAEVAPHVTYTNTYDPNPYSSDDTYPKEGYKDVHTIEFDSYYSWDQARLYGISSTVRNVAAFEDDEKALGNINGWSGEPDNPTKNHNQRAMNAVGNDKDLMTGLHPERTDDHTAFVYAGSVLKSEEVDFSAATELRKYVTRDGLGLWTTGRGNAAQVTVTEGGCYSYMLYVCSDGNTTTKNIIFLDTLENYVPSSSDEDDYGRGRWQGDFVSIDTSEMESLGISPVIYYNTTVPNLQELKGKEGAGSETTAVGRPDYIHNYLQGNGWTTVCPSDKSTIKAIAVDIRKKTDGTDFELEPDQSIYCTVRMKAKVYETAGESTDPFNANEELRKQAENNDYAFNNIFMSCTQVDTFQQETHAVINYNYVRVGIVPFEYKVKKVWDDAGNNDGRRPTAITVHLLANGRRMTPDRTITLSQSNDWSGKFEHVIQYDDNGDWINYTFEEEPAEGTAYTLDGYRMGTEKTGENVTLTNTYTPEKVSVPFTKEWEYSGAEEAESFVPESITVRLIADGVFTGKTMTVKPDRLGNWAGSFNDLPKYANPEGLSGRQHEIEYTLEEVPVYRFNDSYEKDPETGSIKITNTYHPYGDLVVEKTLKNETAASKDKAFTFTLLLRDPDGNDLTEKYEYEITPADGGEPVTGTIGNGDSFTIHAGDKFKVKEIPSESAYEVIESELAGFELTGESGTTGTIRAGAARNVSFTNTYSAEGSQLISLKKTLDGRTMSRNQFRFELVDKTAGSADYDKVIRTTSSDQNGSATFGRLIYAEEDHGRTFTYEIREIDREKPGYTYDETTYKVDVTVTDNGDGTMTCVPKYYTSDGTEVQASDIIFNNTYEARGDITLRAWKQLPAGTLEEDQFSFELYAVDADGHAVRNQIKTNDANGTVTFDKLSFTQADAGKKYLYFISEVKGDDTDVIYDTSLKGIELSVADNGDGTMAVTQTNVTVIKSETDPAKYTKGGTTSDLPLFVNGLEDGDISLTKQTTWGDSEPDGDISFPFTLTLGGEEIPKKITVQLSDGLNEKEYSTGNAPTPLEEADKLEKEVTLEEGGIYRFNLKAGQKLTVKGLPAGTTYQFQEDIPSGWTLSFDNVAGTVQPNDEQEAVYTNRFEPGKAVATVLATKRMDGSVPEANKFAFQLVDDNEGTPKYGQVLQELPNQPSGFVLFDLEYDKVGEYHYLMREVQKPISSVDGGVITYSENEDDLRKIQFDEKEYGITVTVTNTGTESNPTLSASVVYDGSDKNKPPQFVNTSRPGSLEIRKAAEGLTEENKDAVFTFKVTLSNDAGMPLTGEGGMYYYTRPSDVQSGAEPTPAKPAQPENSEPAAKAAAGGRNSRSMRMLAAARGPLAAPLLGAGSITKADYSYTGNVQAFTAPLDGYYRFEAWGAQGGTVNSLSGGRGGYTAGSVYLEKGQTIYVYVGGAGGTTSGVSNTILNGGWNGGGVAANMQSGFTSRRYGAGGGATDFRLANGNWRDFNSLKTRIMVAGGGGGATNNSGSFPGGGAGGLVGINGTGYWWDHGSPGFGGGQNYPGYAARIPSNSMTGAIEYKDRIAGFGYSNTNAWASAGGGSGYYGGGGSMHSQSAAGGSSFISGYPGCDAISEESVSNKIVHTGQPVHYSGIQFINTQMRNGVSNMPSPSGSTESGHWGNGFARVSYGTLSFDPNGEGTGEMEQYAIMPQCTMTLPECQFQSDLVFAGWSTDPDAVVPEYADCSEFTAGADSGNITLYAVWMSEDAFLIHYDANGGYSETQWQMVNGPEEVFEMPAATHPNSYDFLYWSTNADGSGDRYSGSVNASDLGVEPGSVLTLYAQYADPASKSIVTVKHYLETEDGAGQYSSSPANIDRTAHEIGDSVTPPVRAYRGFKTTNTQTVTAAAGGVTVNYYYDRTRYTIVFDANTGTGSMADLEMLGGISKKLPVSGFTKDNAIFVGWNTAADGSGINYGDGQSINSIGNDRETVTLYAQWFDLDGAEQAQPTNGEYTVTCKANETIVFPQLPAGTNYTVTEVSMPDGWNLKRMSNGSGTVLGAERVDVTALNRYTASGKADIVAHKFLPGETISDGQFTFKLFDESGSELQTKTNSGTDNMEEVDDNGTLVPNKYYGSSVVYFDTIEYTKQGVYHYTIKEVAENDPTIVYDSHKEHVTVYVTDRGNGRLNTQVMYDESGADFRNEKGSGDLKVSKKVLNATAAAQEAQFTFTVYLFGSNDNELTEEYAVEKSNGEKTTVRSGGAVSIKGGESFTVKGLPHRCRYVVAENPAAGFELASSKDTEGTIQAGETAEAGFENAYTSRTSEAEGGAVIEAKKVFENAEIEEEQFKFRLLDSEMEEIETVYAETDGTIKFSPLQFTLDDDGQRYVYYIEEIPGNEERVTYDTHRERVAVVVNDNGDGTMKAEVVYATGETPVFTNVYEPYKTSVSGLKTWDDGNNRDGKRPSSIMIRLMADGEEVAMKTVTARDGWRYTFDGLMKYDSDGNEIRYTITEGNVSGYSVKYSGYNITNSYTPGKVNVPVTKVWKDNNNELGIRPSSITIRLYADGSDTGKTLTLSESNNWAGSFDGLDEYRSGSKIDYIVREDSVDGYTTELKGDAASGYTIINTATPIPPEEPDEPTPDTPRRRTPRRTTPRRSSGEVRHNYRSARRNMILRKTADGYILIEDNGVPLAKFPTGDEIQLMVMIAVSAAAAGVIIWLTLLGRRKKKESR